MPAREHLSLPSLPMSAPTARLLFRWIVASQIMSEHQRQPQLPQSFHRAFDRCAYRQSRRGLRPFAF